MPRFVMLCYDICDPRRLRKVTLIAQEFGDRIQFSVFLCRLSQADRVVLENRLGDTIDRNSDRIMLVDLGPAGDGLRYPPGISIFGRPSWAHERGPVVF